MTRRRHLITHLIAVLAIAALAIPGTAAAQVDESAESTSRFGIGFQSAWPSYGISGLYDISDRITAQAIVGAFGTVTNFGARGIYRFNLQDGYNIYGFGTAGLWSYDYIVDTESVIGAGGGVGIELDWRSLLSSEESRFPPLFTSIDLGFVLANFDHYNFSGISFGGGLHYRF